MSSDTWGQMSAICSWDLKLRGPMPNGDRQRKVDANTVRITRPALSATILKVLDDNLCGGGGQAPGRLNSSVFSFDADILMLEECLRGIPATDRSLDTYIAVIRVPGPRELDNIMGPAHAVAKLALAKQKCLFLVIARRNGRRIPIFSAEFISGWEVGH